MPAPSLKLLSVAIGISGIATGAGLGIYQVIKTPNKNEEAKPAENSIPQTPVSVPQTKVSKKITVLLQEKRKEILNKDGNDGKWNKNWKQFKQDYENKVTKPSWTFAETSDLSKVETAPQNFKTQCEKNKELQNTEDDKLFQEVLTYCTDNGE